MQATVIIGIIGAICTLASPIIALLVKEAIDSRFLITISPFRRKAIVGDWKAVIIQETLSEGGRETFPGTCHFDVGRKVVTGRFTYDNAELGTVVLNLKGGFYSDRFLKCEYSNEAARVVQFGVIIAELSANALSFRGRFLGFGANSEILVAGTVTAERMR